MKSGVVIYLCFCKHKFQDERYGTGKRVFNLCGKPEKNQDARCTVCGRTVRL